MADVEDILEHFGVKGMKWGVRKNRATVDVVSDTNGHRTTVKFNPKKAQVVKGENGQVNIVSSSRREINKIQKQIDRHPTDDAARANAAAAKAKKSGTNSLTNKELQDLVTRMNLEKQLKNLTPPSKSSAAVKFTSDIVLQVGKQQIAKLASDALSKQIANAMNKK